MLSFLILNGGHSIMFRIPCVFHNTLKKIIIIVRFIILAIALLYSIEYKNNMYWIVFETDTGRLVEDTKAQEIMMLKELGKITR